MSYSNIKRLLSAAMLLAFTTPSTVALAEEDFMSEASPALREPSVVNVASYNSTLLSGDVMLTDKNENITLSLRDSDVKQVLRMFADKAGLNIVFHSSVTGKVTLDLVDMPINEAFNLVLQVTGMSYYKQGNTMIVMEKKHEDNAVYSKQEMMIFPVKYVSASKIADFLNKNVFSMKKTGLSGIDAATVNSATNELIVMGMPSDMPIVKKVIEQFDKEPFSKTFSVNHTTPAEMANMICQLLLPSRGISGSNSGERGASTGFAASFEESLEKTEMKLGEGVVACSVAPTPSGNISPFSVQNLSVAYFPQRGTITLMGGSEAQAEMVENFIKANDVKQPQAFLEISIVELNEQGSKEFSNYWQISTKSWGFDFNGSSLRGGRPGGIAGNYIPTYDYVWDGPDGKKDPYEKDDEWEIPEQIKRTFYQIAPAQTYVSWTMNYLIQNSKARVLANPKILITNGQQSVIDLTEDYVEKVTSEYLTSTANGEGSSGTAQKNYTIADDLGIKVTLVPFISPEGYVTLNIKPQYSTKASEVMTPSQIPNQYDLAATLLSRRDLDLKNVRIKDGETLVIGGMINESETKVVTKIPILGDLPLIGPLFRSSSTKKAKSELVIMITPKILNDDEGVIADSL